MCSSAQKKMHDSSRPGVAFYCVWRVGEDGSAPSPSPAIRPLIDLLHVIEIFITEWAIFLDKFWTTSVSNQCLAWYGKPYLKVIFPKTVNKPSPSDVALLRRYCVGREEVFTVQKLQISPL